MFVSFDACATPHASHALSDTRITSDSAQDPFEPIIYVNGNNLTSVRHETSNSMYLALSNNISKSLGVHPASSNKAKQQFVPALLVERQTNPCKKFNSSGTVELSNKNLFRLSSVFCDVKEILIVWYLKVR